MNLVPTVCDSRGKQSATLFFVATSWGAVTIKFILSWFDMGTLSATDYATAVALILAAWLGREWQARSYERLE